MSLFSSTQTWKGSHTKDIYLKGPAERVNLLGNVKVPQIYMSICVRKIYSSKQSKFI